ncbi:hypothetical protein H6F55_15820 [Phormidium sp. FACHB-322]|uniref:hypothetical protein n=1 Tax=Cyanophyceae TaxID=3028117 RepID=UPI001684FF9E|nr:MULTISPECIES: hypothetical protein [Cyanophyceae]MBD1918564.1 hypothetical protein [Phormidium sp. FACHB-77]MBD2031453.1 hypothetical protein [Phormidium sp. FACHB-322]MBD2049572.1 hypothetical protein [Leptolyngbya sp. FACHB-60]
MELGAIAMAEWAVAQPLRRRIAIAITAAPTRLIRAATSLPRQSYIPLHLTIKTQ